MIICPTLFCMIKNRPSMFFQSFKNINIDLLNISGYIRLSVPTIGFQRNHNFYLYQVLLLCYNLNFVLKFFNKGNLLSFFLRMKWNQGCKDTWVSSTGVSNSNRLKGRTSYQNVVKKWLCGPQFLVESRNATFIVKCVSIYSFIWLW